MSLAFLEVELAEIISVMTEVITKAGKMLDKCNIKQTEEGVLHSEADPEIPTKGCFLV